METNLDNIISKINKLHKFYESAKKINSEEEANNAALLIQKLLTEYNLSLEDIDLNAGAGSKEKKLIEDVISCDLYKSIGGKWQSLLVNVVAKFNYCRGYRFITKGFQTFRVVGKKQDVESVLWLYCFLCESFVKLGKERFAKYAEIKKENGLRVEGSETFLRNYLLGCVYGINIRFREMKEKIEAENENVTALVVKNDALLQEYEDNLGIVKESRKINVKINTGFEIGVVDAGTMNLNKPLSNQNVSNAKQLA